MSSKDQILSMIRRQNVPQVSLPKLDANWITYADPTQQFIEMVAAVGGTATVVENYGEVSNRIGQIPSFSDAKRVFSSIPEVSANQVELENIDDPHDLEDVDFSIFSGQFGVAENGAIWMSEQGLKHRVLLFISQHLVIVLPASEIVDNMHQAYDRIQNIDQGFSLFMSGPSKTADIEQSLVVGAHGARSLNVFLVEQI